MKLFDGFINWYKKMVAPRSRPKTLDVADLLQSLSSPLMNEDSIKLVKIGQIDLKGRSSDDLLKTLSMIDKDS